MMKTLRYFANAMWFFVGMDVALIAIHIANGHPVGVVLAIIGFVGCGFSALSAEQKMTEAEEH